MARGQRIFQSAWVFAGGLALVTFALAANGHAEDRALVADGKLSVEIPDGWNETDLNAGRTVAGWATGDNRTSAFFVRFPAGGGSMRELIDGTIANFDEAFDLRKESKPKTGQVDGPGDEKWPAIFKTLEGYVEKGERQHEMRFYLLIFDVGSNLYLMQATTTIPVRDVRERQIYEFIRSIIARP